MKKSELKQMIREEVRNLKEFDNNRIMKEAVPGEKVATAAIKQLNQLAKDPRDGFWLTGLAKKMGPAIVAVGRFDELTHWAQVAVRRYVKVDTHRGKSRKTK